MNLLRMRQGGEISSELCLPEKERRPLNAAPSRGRHFVGRTGIEYVPWGTDMVFKVLPLNLRCYWDESSPPPISCVG